MDFTGERVVLGRSAGLVENEHLARYRFAAKLVQGKLVADIACGTGYGTLLLAKAGAQSVHGMDISADVIASNRERLNAPNVTFSVANAEHLSLIPDGEYDVVISFETIEHLPNVEPYLDEMVRVLRPGGIFLVSTPDKRIASVMHFFLGHPRNPFHVREYDERELIHLLSSRFQIEAIFGQAFLPHWLVFWPVQVFIKAFCHILGTPNAREFKDQLYSKGGRVEVTPREGESRIPKFWVISCIRQEK
jgi:O-antigen biosynthesis protein